MRTVLSIMLALTLCGAVAAQEPSGEQDQPEKRPLRPLPPLSEIPPLGDTSDLPSPEELKVRAEMREYRQQIRLIRHRYLGNNRDQAKRQLGIVQLLEFTDPASFVPLVEELSDEKDDVRLALLDHFARQGEWGQAALAWTAITQHQEHDQALHYEALKRLTVPASDPVLSIIDMGIRSDDDLTANLAGRLAGHLQIFDAIPLLIHAQSETRPVEQTGDQAWILVGRRQVYIQALIPIIGDGSGAFLPVPGVLTEGVILRVIEAVAVIYRTEIHDTLVAMSSKEWGRSTADFGYDKERWQAWYNNEYLPLLAERRKIEELANTRHKKDGGE